MELFENKTEKMCQARQHSDQMYCSKCDLTWDMNDLDPPKCGQREGRSNAMNQDMKFAITLIIVGGVMSSFSTTNDWGGWIVALGILIGLCA